MECIISKCNNSVEILKFSATYNFAWQKSGGGHGPPGPPSFAGPDLIYGRWSARILILVGEFYEIIQQTQDFEHRELTGNLKFVTI